VKTTATLHWGLFLVLAATIASPLPADEVRRDIHFPDLPGYQTLECDLHMHTVFSDGQVWPTVRVDEAWRQGLDAIAITDHIEYQPHKDDVPTNHNRPYELAAGAAKAHGLLLPRAAEITRDTPPGHFNAIFVNDVAPLDTPDFVEAIKQANQQGAFVFWNHQGWKGEEAGRWLDVHTTLFENGWFQGMEVCNNDSYYPSAHQWCLDKNLTMMGNSDIHEPDLRRENTFRDHRTMTLVFVKERTLDGLKEALLDRRTVVWFGGQLIGRKEWLELLFVACIEVLPSPSRSGKTVWVQIRNASDADVELVGTGGPGPQELTLPAAATTLVKVAAAEGNGPLELKYTATNFLVAPDTGLPVVLTVPAR
jgi:hypothetical protein